MCDLSLPQNNVIEYRETRDLPREGVLELYGACRRSSAEMPNQLMAALAGSHTIVSAWDGEQLVGLGTAITDGSLVVHYPHLLVHPEYQRRGIGREIMLRLTDKFAGYQHSVLADERAIGFYRNCGFTQPAGIRPMWIYSGLDHNPPDSDSFWYELSNWQRLAPRQQWAIGFALAQLVATIAAGLSLMQLDWILLTWPALAIIGFAFCLVTWPLRSIAAFSFGVSAPFSTALWACLLVLMHWGNAPGRVSRHDAAELLSGWIVSYGILLLPLFGVTLYRVVRWPKGMLKPSDTTWQFSLRSLLVLMTAVAFGAPVMAAAARVVNDKFAFWLFGSYAIILFTACGIAIERFVTERRKGRSV